MFLGPEGIPYTHTEKEIKMANSKALNSKSFIHNSTDTLNVVYARCSFGARDITVNDSHKISSLMELFCHGMHVQVNKQIDVR